MPGTPGSALSPGKASAPGTPSPTITPLHRPQQQAKVLPQPQPLGVAKTNSMPVTHDNSGAGLGQKALLAKKFARANKPTISPTDQMQSPTTQKLTVSKQRHFGKGKPASLAQSFTAIRDSSGASSNADMKSDF